MKKVTLKEQILWLLDKKQDWIVKEDIVQTIMKAYLARGKKKTSDTIGRTLRDLAEGNEINLDYRGNKKIAWYAPLTAEKPAEKKTVYKPVIPAHWT